MVQTASQRHPDVPQLPPRTFGFATRVCTIVFTGRQSTGMDEKHMTNATWTCTWAGSTHQGKVRLQNQDQFYIDPDGRFFILADGMGGHSGGEVASERTVEAVRETIDALDWNALPETHTIAKKCIEAATESLRQWIAENTENEDMGTTLLVCFRNNGKIGLFSLGDSRIYLQRDNRLFQLTFDQVIESELRRRGASRNQASRSPGAAYLSRCVLASRACEPDVMDVEIRTGDLWLMCSDGLTREVENAEIQASLSVFKDNGAKHCVEELISKALDNGGRDNVTVITIGFQ